MVSVLHRWLHRPSLGTRSCTTDSAGSATSNVVHLHVTPAPGTPRIVTQPQSVAVIVGERVVFSVKAEGAQPMTYEWKRNDVPIPGAAGAEYALTYPTRFDSGVSFSVVVSNAAGSVTSDAALLTVYPRDEQPTSAKGCGCQAIDAGLLGFVIAAARLATRRTRQRLIT